jgi:hypothetical protein
MSAMAKPTAMDEYFVHQIPQMLPEVVTHHHHWRESYFYDFHDPSGTGDVVFFTMAHYPAQQRMDSLQMATIGGEQITGFRGRPYDGDPHTTSMPGARVEVVEPMREVRLWADAADAEIGFDITWRARTEPYGLRRGTMRAGDDVVWDQCHMFQSGTYNGTITARGATIEVKDWIGQRDHSWGIRDHGRCPLWIWWQTQLEDGFLGVWHWEYPNGARVYTDGCWAPTDGSDPVPLRDFRYEAEWVSAEGRVAYGLHGEAVTGLRGRAEYVLEDGRTIGVDATGTFARPYEPFHRGGLNLMQVRTDDGREGSAVWEVTGARHHHFFPDTEVSGVLPS